MTKNFRGSTVIPPGIAADPMLTPLCEAGGVSERRPRRRHSLAPSGLPKWALRAPHLKAVLVRVHGRSLHRGFGLEPTSPEPPYSFADERCSPPSMPLPT